jgi:hypothetical protein
VKLKSATIFSTIFFLFNVSLTYFVFPMIHLLSINNISYLYSSPHSPFYLNNPYIFVLPTSYRYAIYDAFLALFVIYKYEILIILPISAILLSPEVMLWSGRFFPQIFTRNDRKKPGDVMIFWYSIAILLSTQLLLLSIFSLGMYVSLMTQLSDILLVTTVVIVLLAMLFNGFHEKGFNVPRVKLSLPLLYFSIILSIIWVLSFLLTVFSPFRYVPVQDVMFLLPVYLLEYPGSLFYLGFIALVFAVNILTYTAIMYAGKCIFVSARSHVNRKAKSKSAHNRVMRVLRLKIFKIALTFILVILMLAIAIEVPVSHPIATYNVLFAPVYNPGTIPIYKGQEIIAGDMIPINVSANSTLVGAWTSPSAAYVLVATGFPPLLNWGQSPYLYPPFNGTLNISLSPGVYSIIFNPYNGYTTIVYVTKTIKLIQS